MCSTWSGASAVAVDRIPTNEPVSRASVVVISAASRLVSCSYSWKRSDWSMFSSTPSTSACEAAARATAGRITVLLGDGVVVDRVRDAVEVPVGVELLLQVGRQRLQRDARALRQVGGVLALAAGVRDHDDARAARPAAGAEHLERLDPVAVVGAAHHAVRPAERVERRVGAGDGAGVGERALGADAGWCRP